VILISIDSVIWINQTLLEKGGYSHTHLLELLRSIQHF